MDKSLLLKAVLRGHSGLLLLNGMVLCKLHDRQEVRLPVHEFVQAGGNCIQIQLPVKADSLSASDCEAEVFVELQKDRGERTFVQPSVLFKLESSVLKGQRLKKSCVLDASVDLPVSFPRWRYLDVMQSAAQETDQLRIQDFLLNFIALLRNKKLAALLPYFSVRNREVAVAYGLDMQQVHKHFSDYIEQLCLHHQLSEKTLDPAQWVFKPVLSSSVYALLNQEQQPLFQFVSMHNQDIQHWPMHVGVLGGEVFVMR